MPSFTHEGTYAQNALVVGDWAEVTATPLAGSALYVGSSKNGVLSISREVYEHVGTSFPRMVDMRVTLSVGMRYEGDLEEVHAENIALVTGQPFASPGNYLYFGEQEVITYFTLHALRRRPHDKKWMEAHLFKCTAVAEVQLAGGDEAISARLEAVAHDDSEGVYGGSAVMPLGWVYAPTQSEST